MQPKFTLIYMGFCGHLKFTGKFTEVNLPKLIPGTLLAYFKPALTNLEGQNQERAGTRVGKQVRLAILLVFYQFLTYLLY